jgi:hypothetical protein
MGFNTKQNPQFSCLIHAPEIPHMPAHASEEFRAQANPLIIQESLVFYLFAQAISCMMN